MIKIDDALQCLECLEVVKKKFVLREIVESIGVTYVRKTRCSIDTMVWAFEHFILSTYNRLRKDFQLTSISPITKLTSKVKTIVRSFLVR